MNYEDLELVNNEAGHSFELLVEGHRAFIDYGAERPGLRLPLRLRLDHDG